MRTDTQLVFDLRKKNKWTRTVWKAWVVNHTV